MKYCLILPNSEMWNEMWGWLKKHPHNLNLEEPHIARHNNNEWEYMGTIINNKKAISSFRHLSHPNNNQLIKISFEHKIYNELDITKKTNMN